MENLLHWLLAINLAILAEVHVFLNSGTEKQCGCHISQSAKFQSEQWMSWCIGQVLNFEGEGSSWVKGHAVSGLPRPELSIEPQI